MTPERLAEFRTFALGAIPQVAQLSDESESTRVIISTCASAMLELIDALTAERERAEKAEAELDKLNQSGDLGMNAKQEKFSFRERRQ